MEPEMKSELKLGTTASEETIKQDNEKRSKFVKLAEGRAQAALTAIRKIGNLSNRRSYDYDETDVRKMTRALKDAIADMERKFDPNAAPGQKAFRL
jgi:hypothetical protein